MRAHRWRRVDPVPWSPLRKPLATCRLALVVSSVCLSRGPEAQTGVAVGDPQVRVIPGDVKTAGLLVGAQRGANADATDPADPSTANLDRNLAYALDRLREVATDGRIGELSPRHLALCGVMAARARDVERRAPDVARVLAADSVDAALLVPACPLCGQSLALVAGELERRGVATVTLQLLHRPDAAVRAPRSLWVPFWHGYALGSPDSPGEQRAVVEAAFAMLEDTTLTPPAWRDFAPPPAL